MARSRVTPDPFTQPRWRRRKEARPSEILDAALPVFAEKGFSATRIDDIAQRAGVTKGTVYLYFPSKQAVFEALVRQAILPQVEALEALTAAHQGPVIPLIGQIFQEAATRLRRELLVFPRLIIAEAGNFPEIVRFYHAEVISRAERLLAGLYARGVASGEFPDLDPRIVTKLVIAPMLLGAIWTTTIAQFEDRPLDLAALVRTHVDIFTRGLAALAREAS